MKIIAMEVGYIATNCYIVINEETHQAVVIDPGGDADRIMAAVEKENAKVDAIFLTHGHGDHIMALGEVKERTGAPIYISEADAPLGEIMQSPPFTPGSMPTMNLLIIQPSQRKARPCRNIRRVKNHRD